MTEAEVDYRPTNRESARQPRGRSFWCNGCDRNIVWAGQRCRNCGGISGKLRRAKPNGNT